MFFGTFNPIHVGHLIIANHMADHTDLEQVWLVVTPQNPMKKKSTLLADHHRLAMARRALEYNTRLKVSDIEFHLPKPSFTVNTLAYLQEKHPEHEFALIMGEDNIRTLHKWKNSEVIVGNHEIYVYPRAFTPEELTELEEQSGGLNVGHADRLGDKARVHLVDAPVMRVSASFIRKSIKEEKDVRYLLTEPVYEYCTGMHFYEK